MASAADIAPLALTSALSGIVARCVTHPFDTLRARQQVQTAPLARSSFAQMLGIARAEGIRALYRGFGVAMVFTVPAQSSYFTTYELVKGRLGDPGAASTHLSAGFLAETVSGLFWAPMEVVKNKQQVLPKVDARALVRRVVAEEGVAGLFKGYPLMLATFGPFSAIYFAAYEQCKVGLSRVLPDARTDSLPFLGYAACGFVSGGLAAAATCPLDVVKTRLQVQGKEPTLIRYSGIFSALVGVFRKEGIGALFRGLVPRVLWLAPGTAVTIAVYDELKEVMGIRMDEKR